MTQMSIKWYDMIIYQQYNEYTIISNEYNNDMKTVYSIFFQTKITDIYIFNQIRIVMQYL